MRNSASAASVFVTSLLLSLGAAAACQSTVYQPSDDVDTAGGGDEEADADTDSDTDTDTDSDTDADTDSDTDTDTDTDTDSDTDADSVVRFVAMGDGGEGNDDQYAVADALETVCAAKTDDLPGCDFVLYLGDNFYDSGVDSVDDDQFQDKFELPYANLDLPFYVVLGNHDYGSTSLEFWKSSYEIEYSDYSDKWNMPSEFYSFEMEHALFLGLDTNAIMLEDLYGDVGQDTWIDSEIASSSADWKIAFGHHPYISNGKHGNAGSYEGYEWLPIANGATIKSFMDDHLCGQVDVYLCGHDHNRQWLEPQCGTEFVVTGAAAKTTDDEERGNPAYFEDFETEGFFWVELRGDVMTGEFWDKDGNLDISQTVTRSK